MTQRQVIHSVDADDYLWLRSLADADNTGVGEVVRRIVRWARESQDEPAARGPTPEEIEAERREAERQQRLAYLRAEVEALERGDAGEYNDDSYSGPPIVPDNWREGVRVATLDTSSAQQAQVSVLDLDFSNEPRADEIEVPPDPDDVPVQAFQQQRPTAAVRQNEATTVARGDVARGDVARTRPVPSLLDSTYMTPPSGTRPGTATRPAPPNRDLAIGLRNGDAVGNVVRANFSHLGFSRGGV